MDKEDPFRTPTKATDPTAAALKAIMDLPNVQQVLEGQLLNFVFQVFLFMFEECSACHNECTRWAHACYRQCEHWNLVSEWFPRNVDALVLIYYML